jgi:hypothetical protein
MPVTDAELNSLAQTRHHISIGMLADEVRRRLQGTKTTFVRVATVASDVGAPISRPAAAGELRIVGVPVSRAAAVQRVAEVAAAARGAAVTAFSLADLEPLSAREGITLRALLEELRAAGLSWWPKPVDRRGTRSGRRGSEHRRPVARASHGRPVGLSRSVARLKAVANCSEPASCARSPRSSPGEPRRADHRL